MSDYTNIIQEINTNIPDNTDQSITALKVRTTLIDMLDAVDDNMTEAIGEISVPTKTSDLTNDSGFITATSLEPYVTKTELSNASYVTQNELNSASYVTESQLQQAGYVTQSALNSMSYVTESQLQLAGYVTQSALNSMSYATTSFVDDAIADAFEDSDFMTETDVNNLLSTASYVTSEQLSAMGYITNQDLEQTLSNATYVTQSDISNMGYVTRSEIAASGYVTQSALNSMSYVTESQLNNASYVNTTQLNEAISGITVPTKTSDLTNDSGFITASDLNGYATETYVSDYVAQHAPTPDLSAYVSKVELSSMGYITASDVSQMGYITANDLPDMSSYATLTYLETYYATLQNLYDTEDALHNVMIDANILIADPETGDWTTQAMASETYVSDYVAAYAPTPDLSTYVTKTELSNAGYITANDLPDMSSYATLTYLETYYATLQNVSDTANTMQQVLIDANVLTVDPETADIIVEEMATENYVAEYVAQHAPTPDLSAYVTKTELSNMSYVTQSALNSASYVTSSDLSNMSYATTSQLATKQDTLVSGTNIKTVNNNSLLGSGNITISSSGNIIAEVTQAEYDAMQQAGTLDPNTIYVITDAPATDLSYYVLQSDLENMGYITSTALSNMSYATTSQLPNMADYVSKTELNSMSYVTQSALNSASYATTSQLSNKQDTLVSGTNIKTINNESLLGSGNITISGEANVIESISVNGTTQTVTNKNVNITVPTNTNQLTNGAGFLTAANFIYDSTNNTLTINI